MVDIENRNALYLEGKLKPDAFKPHEWRAIQEHDRLMELWEADQRMAAQ